MNQFLSGTLAMGFGVAGLFFLRFWWKTRDRLFGIFALAFFLMAATRVELSFSLLGGPRNNLAYWVRLAAFGLILVAILEKNRPQAPATKRPS